MLFFRELAGGTKYAKRSFKVSSDVDVQPGRFAERLVDITMPFAR